MPEILPETALALLLADIDHRLRRALIDEALRSEPASWSKSGHLVLVGHRAAGKSRLLPHVARAFGRPSVDLDRAIERRVGRPLREYFDSDPSGFRDAERAAFSSIAEVSVVAVGGGFLSLHADLLAGHTAVLVPITFDTYRARLLADPSRPRLRPELSMEEEIRAVFDEREEIHRMVRTLSLPSLLRAMVEQGKASRAAHVT